MVACRLLLLSACLATIVALPAHAQNLVDTPTPAPTADTQTSGGNRGHRFLDFVRAHLAKQKQNEEAAKLDTTPDGTQGVMTENFKGRDIDIYVPIHLPPEGTRTMLVILHGGGGNSTNVRKSLHMDAMADKYGFIIAYPNGTTAGEHTPDKMHAWNAGGSASNGCCGKPFTDNVDDVGYLSAAIHELITKFAVNPQRIYGMGHSNGAMMTQRLMCETNLYQASVPISGPLNIPVTTCPNATGKRILAIHGAMDENVPVAGGRGTKGVTNIDFVSEAKTQEIWQASGATYTVDLVRDADHYPPNIRADLVKYEGITLSEKTVQFLGLDRL